MFCKHGFIANIYLWFSMAIYKHCLQNGCFESLFQNLLRVIFLLTKIYDQQCSKTFRTAFI